MVVDVVLDYITRKHIYVHRMADEHYMLDQALERIKDDEEPMTYGSDEEFEDLMVE